MSSAADEIFAGVAEAYDALRPELMKVDGIEARCHLLGKVGETSDYDILLELTSGWYIVFEAYRGQSLLKVARTDSTFIDAFNEMSDFSFNGYVYTIEEPNRDKLQPQGKDFFYGAFGLKNGDKITLP